MHKKVINRLKITLIVTKNWFNEHPFGVKNPYMIPVNVMAAAYKNRVPPIKIYFHLSEYSIFSKHLSVQLCAKSTRSTRPNRIKIAAPVREK